MQNVVYSSYTLYKYLVKQMKDLNKFLNVDLESWVFGTIKKVQQSGINWNAAWKQTYEEIGGKSPESGRKGCPMKGAETLYLLGRINGGNMPFKASSFHDVCQNFSKNGAYAILALDVLSQEPGILLTALWCRIQTRVRELGECPAKSNQGGPTVAFKLWHLGLINNP